MEAALYWTIWIALALLTAGEALKTLSTGRRVRERVAWFLSSLGAVIAVIHVVLAMHVRHDWSHAAAIAATARQTETVYGLDWGGGYFANYLFLVSWIAELIAWRVSPERYLRWAGWSRELVRAFYVVMIANAAIVFAGGMRRMLGAALVLTLVASWWTPRRREAQGLA